MKCVVCNKVKQEHKLNYIPENCEVNSDKGVQYFPSVVKLKTVFEECAIAQTNFESYLD